MCQRSGDPAPRCGWAELLSPGLEPLSGGAAGQGPALPCCGRAAQLRLSEPLLLPARYSLLEAGVSSADSHGKNTRAVGVGPYCVVSCHPKAAQRLYSFCSY